MRHKMGISSQIIFIFSGNTYSQEPDPFPPSKGPHKNSQRKQWKSCDLIRNIFGCILFTL